MGCPERRELQRALLGFYAALMLVTIADLAGCRLRNLGSCDQQAQAISAGAAGAAGWIAGVLTKHPEP